MNNPGVMTVETGLGPESTGIKTYSLKIDGKPAFVASMFTDNSGENAHRMAACWNACAGLDVDLLARFGLGTATGSSICRLREQNAELIEALRGLDEAYCRAGHQLTRIDRAEDRKRLMQARAAIAKATGEQQ